MKSIYILHPTTFNGNTGCTLHLELWLSLNSTFAARKLCGKPGLKLVLLNVYAFRKEEKHYRNLRYAFRFLLYITQLIFPYYVD